ncbi:MAG: hypothetical protein QNJ40_00435 [Xanthomonadales bacterium]|nr:hypothetical protein [Xanthomonadales bacterium]
MAHWIALSLAVVSTLLALRSDHEAAIGVAALNLLGLSMIFRPGWWTFWLPLGFWEQLARDKGSADQQGAAIAFLGWIVLMLVLILAIQL